MWSDLKRVSHNVLSAEWHGEVPVLVWLTPLSTHIALSFYGIPPCCGMVGCFCGPDQALPPELTGSVNLTNVVWNRGFPPELQVWLSQSSKTPDLQSYEWIIFQNEFDNGLQDLCVQVRGK